MDTIPWAKLHGAATHLPLALLMCAVLFEVGPAVLPKYSTAGTRAVAYWSVVLAGVGSFPAVLSGLMMTRGTLLGNDLIRLHHLFIWPAFALVTGLAAWRIFMGSHAAGRPFVAYLLVLSLASGFMAAAGYWGGELLLAS